MPLPAPRGRAPIENPGYRGQHEYDAQQHSYQQEQAYEDNNGFSAAPALQEARWGDFQDQQGWPPEESSAEYEMGEPYGGGMGQHGLYMVSPNNQPQMVMLNQYQQPLSSDANGYMPSNLYGSTQQLSPTPGGSYMRGNAYVHNSQQPLSPDSNTYMPGNIYANHGSHAQQHFPGNVQSPAQWSSAPQYPTQPMHQPMVMMGMPLQAPPPQVGSQRLPQPMKISAAPFVPMNIGAASFVPGQSQHPSANSNGTNDGIMELAFSAGQEHPSAEQSIPVSADPDHHSVEQSAPVGRRYMQRSF